MADEAFQSEDGDGPAYNPASPWFVRFRALFVASCIAVALAAAAVIWDALR